MSHYVGDDVAPTVDSSGGGIGHILNIRFSYSSLLPMPANFRLSPPPFSRCATSQPTLWIAPSGSQPQLMQSLPFKALSTDFPPSSKD